MSIVNCRSCGVMINTFGSQTSKSYLCDDCRNLDIQINTNIDIQSKQDDLKEGHSDGNLNSGLADIFANLNSFLFVMSIILCFIALFVLVAYGGDLFMFFIILAVSVSIFLFHGAAALIIELVHNIREINKKLDK